MYLIEGNFAPNFVKDCVVSIGVFDGLHLGHQAIIERLLKYKLEWGKKAVIVTFHPHPQKVLYPEKDIFLILPLNERIKLLEEAGIDICWILEANRSFLSLEPEFFIEEYIFKAVSPKKVIIGENFKFGRDGKGDWQLLKKMGEKLGFDVEALPLQKIEAELVSSSKIRSYLKEGRIDKVKQMLARPPILEARVIKGDQRGRILGFPTANLMPTHEFKLGYGVYVIQSEIDFRTYYGLLYVGTIPTFGINRLRYEVYFLNFSQRIYGKILKLKILAKLREERYFSSQRELQLQLQYDEANLIKYLSFHPSFISQ